jgi:hypothetical protein
MSNSLYSGYGQISSNQALPLISQYESGNQNVLTGIVSTTQYPNTASGYYQITNPTWQQYAPGAGIDTSVYPTAMSASQADQTSVAGAIYNAQGIQPWSSNTPLMNAVNSAQGTSGDSIPTMSATPDDTGDSTNTSDSNPSGTDTSYEAGFGDMSGLPSINNAPVPSDSAGGSGAPTADAGAGMSLLQAALGTTASGASLTTLFSDWFTRIVIGILAIGMLIVGFASFKNNSLTITPSGIGSAVRKTVK